MTDPPGSILQAIAKELECHQPHLLGLYSAITELSETRRVAMAVCCAERLYPAYRSLVAEIGVDDGLRPLLEDLWRHAQGVPLGECEILAGRALCLDLPLGEEGCFIQQGVASRAVDAAYHALGACRPDDVGSAYFAAKSAFDAADEEIFAMLADEGECSVIEPEQGGALVQQAARHPLFRAELSLQSALLGQLQDAEVDRERLLAKIASSPAIDEWSCQA